jgi:hypothetical protein
MIPPQNGAAAGHGIDYAIAQDVQPDEEMAAIQGEGQALAKAIADPQHEPSI